ncbi:hypothetical protein POM88_006191 [Heracleum sosnowskyi]|uniref:Uncharacterized protein n=1 Tax=Heracleum sosnowskyi TaxID=360622 RepID=A0AAD8J4E4_9APIA|nr:hypothetical protein POM88_006191 [Heracleum sosnowskyi]
MEIPILNPVYLKLGASFGSAAKGTGLKALEFALSICDSVDMYGFTVDPGYKEWAHTLDCLLHYSKSTMNLIVCYLEMYKDFCLAVGGLLTILVTALLLLPRKDSSLILKETKAPLLHPSAYLDREDEDDIFSNDDEDEDDDHPDVDIENQQGRVSMKMNSKQHEHKSDDIIDNKLGDREDEDNIFSSDDEDEDDDHPDVDIENHQGRVLMKMNCKQHEHKSDDIIDSKLGDREDEDDIFSSDNEDKDDDYIS